MFSAKLARRIGMAALALTLISAPFTPAVAQTYGGTITASITAEPKSLDPLFGDAPSIDPQVLGQIYDTLVRWSPEGRIVPFLADSYAYSDDGLTLTFKLRQGVKFHDGTDLDADAVVYNLERLLDKNVVSQYASGVADVASVVAADPLTVEVHLARKSAVILATYAGPAGMIASPTALKKYGEDFGTHPVGSGPFELEARQAGTSLTLARNADYWLKADNGDSLPYLDTIQFRWITQTAVKMIELESGNVQLADDIQSNDFARVKQDKNLVLIDAGGISHWIAFNITKKPFDDIEVRKAVYYAFNRPMVAQIISGDFGRVIPTLVYPTEFIFDDSIDVYSYDPEKARTMLAEAGYGPDNPLAFDLSMIQREPDVSIAQVLQAQLAEIGVKMNIKQMERQAFIDEWRGNNHQAGLARIDIPRGDPDQTFSPFFGRDSAQRTGAGDEKLFDLVDKGRVTTDQDARRQVYVDAQKRLLDTALYAWIFMRESKHVRSAKLEGMEISPIKTWYLEKAWLAK